MPGEITSPTQPLPDLPAPYARQRLNEETLTTRTPEAHAWALKTFRTFRSNGQFVPFSVGRQTVIFPGFDGGAEWGGPAIDPVTHVLFVNETEMAWTGGLVPAEQGGSPGEQLYRSQCAMCHGVDLAGSPPAFPSLIDVDKRLEPQKITDAVRQGTGRMPSFPNIDSAGLDALLSYLHTGNAAPPHKEQNSAPVEAQPAQPPADTAGAAVYRGKCAVCHGDRLEGVAPFPMLVGVGSRLSATQATEVIQKGRGAMPPMPEVQATDLDALLRYLQIGATAQNPTAIRQHRQVRLHRLPQIP